MEAYHVPEREISLILLIGCARAHTVIIFSAAACCQGQLYRNSLARAKLRSSSPGSPAPIVSLSRHARHEAAFPDRVYWTPLQESAQHISVTQQTVCYPTPPPVHHCASLFSLACFAVFHSRICPLGPTVVSRGQPSSRCLSGSSRKSCCQWTIVRAIGTTHMHMLRMRTSSPKIYSPYLGTCDNCAKTTLHSNSIPHIIPLHHTCWNKLLLIISTGLVKCATGARASGLVVWAIINILERHTFGGMKRDSLSRWKDADFRLFRTETSLQRQTMRESQKALPLWLGWLFLIQSNEERTPLLVARRES